MRSRGISVMLVTWMATTTVEAAARDKPAIQELMAFKARGAFAELNRDLARHRLSLEEIEEARLDGRPIPVLEVVAFMAEYEKLNPKIAEPLEVRGDIRIGLTPNSAGEEAYTTCFLALTHNGLVLSGSGDDLVLVRPETKAELTAPRRRWDRSRILATRLFRLGYLASDPILRRYRDEFGTGEGHAVIVPKANVVIVTDADAALEKLGSWIDQETLAAMGTDAPDGPARGEETRPPSLGAAASRECIHFYLLAFARTRPIPMFAKQQPGSSMKRYPEASLWFDQRGYDALAQEYRRVNELIPIAQQAAAEGWVDPRPDRTLTPAAQRRLEIRFGLVSPLPGADGARTTRKAARKKR